MNKYYTIYRNKDIDPYYSDLADDYMIHAYYYYRDILFLGKKKRLRLIKKAAKQQLHEVSRNLCHHSWICLKDDTTDKNIVEKRFLGAIDSINHVYEMKSNSKFDLLYNFLNII